MRAETILGLVLALAVPLCAADKATVLNIKPGLWSVTTRTVKRNMPVPADMLAKLSPAQRARLEARMRASAQETTKITTARQCLTEEQVEKGAIFGGESGGRGCMNTHVRSSRTKAVVRIVCRGKGVKQESVMHQDALSAESVKELSQLTTTENGQTAYYQAAFTATWLGPVCRPAR